MTDEFEYLFGAESLQEDFELAPASAKTPELENRPSRLTIYFP